MSYRVKELAQRVAPTQEEGDVNRLIRQLRHWTLSGLLELETDIHVGPGRHRRYTETALQTAAVLVALTPYNLPIGTLANVIDCLDILRKFPSRHLQEAVTDEHQVYFLFPPDVKSARLCRQDELADGLEPGPTAIMLNLTAIFSRIRK